MLKLTAQTASFSRAQHWRVGTGMGSETWTTCTAQGPWIYFRSSPPPLLLLPGNRSPTDHWINLLQKESVWPVSCQIGRGGSPSNTLGMHGTETGSPEFLAAWRRLTAQGPMGQERHWAEVMKHQQTLGALPGSTVVLIDGIVIHSTYSVCRNIYKLHSAPVVLL